MILFKKAIDIDNYLGLITKKSLRTGFVPTMGALHEGHISLINQAKSEQDIVIASIFVNPTQFNDPEDFKKYPITTESDISMLEEAGCDILFMPSVEEMYPHGPHPQRHYDLGNLEKRLEGEFRPGHFQGVCMIVHRLLEIVRPGKLYLGQKDFQQCMVIRRLIDLIGMSKQTELVIAATRREADGLAMSSRNRRLSESERQLAPAIYASLTYLRDQLRPGPLDQIVQHSTATLVDKGFRVDYLEIAEPGTLDKVHHWDGKQELVALVAAFLGPVRLIDNLVLHPRN